MAGGFKGVPELGENLQAMWLPWEVPNAGAWEGVIPKQAATEGGEHLI